MIRKDGWFQILMVQNIALYNLIKPLILLILCLSNFLYKQNNLDIYTVDMLSQPNMATSSGLYGKMFFHTILWE